MAPRQPTSPVREPRQNNNSGQAPNSSSNAGNTPEGELEILSDMRWIKYFDPLGRLVAQDADGCGFSRGPSARIAAPTPDGGYWVKSPFGSDHAKVADMILDSGAPEVSYQMYPVYGEATSGFNNDPQVTRFVEYASGRPPTYEGPGRRLVIFNRQIEWRTTSVIVRIKPSWG
ncbi:hypothetical protein NM208_g12928 [Fusarium decemcellulare]|uniref:Uncharacterized protein n=1 Tax=Fusarium decemcellulare TaxID=57161 RepID=A0ACC1RQB4_9HYPO|nr:hypothetical protein NM208_g12928 [Fusarium decemcellulare]